MVKLLVRFFTVVVALFVAAHLVEGIHVDDIYTAGIVAVLLGALNIIVRPILVVLTLPITILTLGLFLLVLNAALFWFVGSFVDGFDVEGFLPALLGSIIVSLLSWAAHKLT